jgi:hypothetical protein
MVKRAQWRYHWGYENAEVGFARLSVVRPKEETVYGHLFLKAFGDRYRKAEALAFEPSRAE